MQRVLAGVQALPRRAGLSATLKVYHPTHGSHDCIPRQTFLGGRNRQESSGTPISPPGSVGPSMRSTSPSSC